MWCRWNMCLFQPFSCRVGPERNPYERLPPFALISHWRNGGILFRILDYDPTLAVFSLISIYFTDMCKSVWGQVKKSVLLWSNQTNFVGLMIIKHKKETPAVPSTFPSGLQESHRLPYLSHFSAIMWKRYYGLDNKVNTIPLFRLPLAVVFIHLITGSSFNCPR